MKKNYKTKKLQLYNYILKINIIILIFIILFFIAVIKNIY